MFPPKVGSNIGVSTNNTTSLAKKSICSNVWDQINRNVERGPDGKVIKTIAKCKICGSVLNAMTKNGTSHLSKHCHGCNQNKNIDIRQMMVLQSSTTGNLSNWTYDQKVARQSIVKWLIKHNLSFLTIKDNHFEQMIQSLQHAFRKFL